MLDGLQIDPIAFRIPPWSDTGFPIYWYGILVTLGIAIGAWWGGREVKRRGGNTDEFYNGLIIVIVSGFVFARLWYVLQEIIAGRGANYNTLGAWFDFRGGGVNILGGFIGAAVIAYIYVRWKKLDFWMYADVAGPSLLIAQAVGRWANFINQELYGSPTTLPWGILIPDAGNRLPQYPLSEFPADTRFHPTFLYESLWLFIGFVLLVFLNNRYRDKWRSGTIFGLFLIWWGGGRAWVELFRPDQPKFGDSIVSYSMVLSILLAIVGGLVLLYRYDKLPIGGGSKRRRKRVHKPKPKREAKVEK